MKIRKLKIVIKMGSGHDPDLTPTPLTVSVQVKGGDRKMLTLGAVMRLSPWSTIHR